jgi:hypothetical protein
MDTGVITTIITASGAILSASIIFLLTKRYERSRDWREKKLIYYQELLSSISGLVVEKGNKHEADKRFATAANTIALVAPQYVIKALMDYNKHIINPDDQNTGSEKHNKLLADLLLAIRQDIDLTTKDNKTTFSFFLINIRAK